MNRNKDRLGYSRLREMAVAVSERAAATGKGAGCGGVGGGSWDAAKRAGPVRLRVHVRQIAFAALALFAVSFPSIAQIVPSGPNGPAVTQTQNGLPQVNINRP